MLSLLVNIPLSQYQHNNKTTGFENVPGIIGIGVAFPPLVKAISGEIEYAVGVGKFWTTASNPAVLEFWRTNTAYFSEGTEAHDYQNSFSTSLLMSKL